MITIKIEVLTDEQVKDAKENAPYIADDVESHIFGWVGGENVAVYVNGELAYGDEL
jgi:hypothetical protein